MALSLVSSLMGDHTNPCDEAVEHNCDVALGTDGVEPSQSETSRQFKFEAAWNGTSLLLIVLLSHDFSP